MWKCYWQTGFCCQLKGECTVASHDSVTPQVTIGQAYIRTNSAGSKTYNRAFISPSVEFDLLTDSARAALLAGGTVDQLNRLISLMDETQEAGGVVELESDEIARLAGARVSFAPSPDRRRISREWDGVMA